MIVAWVGEAYLAEVAWGQMASAQIVFAEAEVLAAGEVKVAAVASVVASVVEIVAEVLATAMGFHLMRIVVWVGAESVALAAVHLKREGVSHHPEVASIEETPAWVIQVWVATA